MADLMFKVYIENICPRIRTRSNFAAKDTLVVSMILARKTFDLPELILKNMLELFDGKSTTGLPYGFLLTKIFEWFRVDFNDVEIVSAKEFIDKKCLAQSSLKVEKDGNLVQVDPPPISLTVILGTSAHGK